MVVWFLDLDLILLRHLNVFFFQGPLILRVSVKMYPLQLHLYLRTICILPKKGGQDMTSFFYNLGNFLEASFSQEIELRKFKVELKYGTPIFYLPLAFTGRIQSISIFYDVDKVEQVE